MFRTSYSTASPRGEASTETTVAEPVRRTLRRSRRLGLLLGAVTLAALPLALLEPAAHWSTDPELMTLLRGMALIKGLLAALAVAAVWWRLGRETTPRFVLTYTGGAWALALAAGLIWQLTAIPAASALFHCATIVLLIAAWRDL